MVERYRRGRGKHRLLGNHQKCWIWGRHAVLETLRAGRWPIIELLVSDHLERSNLEELDQLAVRQDLQMTVVAHEELRSRCKSSEHQGMIAKMTEFPYANSDELLAARGNSPLFLVLDSIQDPYNFGAIIRTADGLGVDSIFIAEQSQVSVTSLVARTSAGAVNHVPIARVPSIEALVHELGRLGVQTVAAHPNAESACFKASFVGPLAIIVGNEATGIRAEVCAASRQLVSIPQQGHVQSLNAAVSASILLYEATRQRSETASPKPTRSENADPPTFTYDFGSDW